MLDAVGIVAQNIDLSLKFYALFGIEFKQYEYSEHYEAIQADGLRLMLDSVSLMKQLNPKWKASKNQNMILAFKKNKSDEVDAIYKKCIQAGALSIKEPWDAFWGQRYASVFDINGNQIDIFADKS